MKNKFKIIFNKIIILIQYLFDRIRNKKFQRLDRHLFRRDTVSPEK